MIKPADDVPVGKSMSFTVVGTLPFAHAARELLGMIHRRRCLHVRRASISTALLYKTHLKMAAAPHRHHQVETSKQRWHLRHNTGRPCCKAFPAAGTQSSFASPLSKSAATVHSECRKCHFRPVSCVDGRRIDRSYACTTSINHARSLSLAAMCMHECNRRQDLFVGVALRGPQLAVGTWVKASTAITKGACVARISCGMLHSCCSRQPI